jgi:hypothetical protein
MASELTHTVSSELAHVLREAFAGPPGPWSYFTENRRGVGMLATIESISAEEASVGVGPDNGTIAGHVNHVRVSLAQSTASVKKESSTRDHTGGWTVTRVNDPEWKTLQRQLREQYERSLQVLQTRMEWDEDALSSALGAITHVAYHLAAIRQRLVVAGILRT